MLFSAAALGARAEGAGPSGDVAMPDVGHGRRECFCFGVIAAHSGMVTVVVRDLLGYSVQKSSSLSPSNRRRALG
jgi:hypothetical protein